MCYGVCRRHLLPKLACDVKSSEACRLIELRSFFREEGKGARVKRPLCGEDDPFNWFEEDSGGASLLTICASGDASLSSGAWLHTWLAATGPCVLVSLLGCSFWRKGHLCYARGTVQSEDMRVSTLDSARQRGRPRDDLRPYRCVA